MNYFTDWETLPEERKAQRREEAEEMIAIGTAPPSDVYLTTRPPVSFSPI